MSERNLLVIIIILMFAIGYAYKEKAKFIQDKPSQVWPEQLPEQEIIHEEIPPALPIPIKPVFPTWENWPKVRNTQDIQKDSLGKILQDIESHMPASHGYRDRSKVTWAHETTHGINANIRNSNKDATKVNGLYCLEDRACVIFEPKMTIQSFADNIPQKLRGPSYQLYLVEQTASWNNRPLYIFDEWIAYTNGTETGRELNHQGWYYELLQAHNFNVYSMYLAKAVKETCPGYDDTQMKAFMMWNIERTFHLAEPFDGRVLMLSGPEEVSNTIRKHLHSHDIPHGGDDTDPIRSAMDYVQKVQTSSDAEEIRKFARSYFGIEWCKRVYGF